MSSLNVPKGLLPKIRWLVEKVKWLIYKVNSGGSGSGSVDVANGLSKDGDTIKLGGALEQGDTLIGSLDNLDDVKGIFLQTRDNPGSSRVDIIYGDYSTGEFSNLGVGKNRVFITKATPPKRNEIVVDPDNTSISSYNTDTTVMNTFKMSLLGGEYSSSTSLPLSYAGDYSSNYTDHSIVDKAYVDRNSTGVNKVYGEDPSGFEFSNTGYYTYDGDTDISKNLPTNGQAVGRRYVILNTTGEGSLTINGDILEVGQPRTSFTIMSGENYIIYNNGIHWVIV